MDIISIEGTAKTPTVYFDANQGKIEIKGRSIPENPIIFFQPLFEWLDKYTKNPKDVTVMDIQLEYFNTSSSKCILEVFRKVQNIHKIGKKIDINWYYEEDDEDMYYTGGDYEAIIKIPFNMIKIKEKG